MLRRSIRSLSILRIASVCGIAAASVALSTSPARAAMIASDNASNYSGGGWGTSTPNLGTGFGPWNFVVTDANNPPYVGTYLDNNNKNIATSIYSWGTYSNTPDSTNANRIDMQRTFTVNPSGYQDVSGLGTLYNQTISAEIQADGVGNGNGGPPNSALGISLETGTGGSATPVLTFAYTGTNATDNAVLTDNDGTNNNLVPVNFSNINGGLIFSVQVGSNPDGLNPYTLTISTAVGNTPLYTYSNFTNGPIQQIDLFDANTTGNGYFNNLNVTAEVPEPASIAVIGGVTMMLGLRRRKA